MKQIVITGTRTFVELTLEAGASDVIEPPSGKLATLTVFPSAGGSVRVEFSTSLPTAVALGEARWTEWSQGVVAEQSADVFDAPVTAIRVTAIDADCVAEFVQ